MTWNALRWSALAAALLVPHVASADSKGAPGPGDRLTYKGREVLHQSYDGVTDDLATAGLGAAGIQSATPPVIADPLNPSAEELRRLAIYNNYRALVDTVPGGGYGEFFGPGVALEPDIDAPPELIAGDEFLVLADVGRTRNVTMMVQVPESFDRAAPCIVTGASSGSRGIYGAIGTSGEWGLKRGCAVAYTDKGTGTGAHDLEDDTVNLIRGERADADLAGRKSNFTAPIGPGRQAAFNAKTPDRFAFKHAHSEDNPEAFWGRHVLASIEFAFFVLNERYRSKGEKHFTPESTLVIASSVSNGGGAALLAAELDRKGLIDGVAVSEPNVNPMFDPRFVIRQEGQGPVVRHSRSLNDYTTLLNVFQGCANAALDNADAPLNSDALKALGDARCDSLAEKGLLDGESVEEQAANAQDAINAYGILTEQNVVQPAQWAINVPQAIAVTYANAYSRAGVEDNLCGYSFGATDPATGAPVPLSAAAEAIIFSTSSGIPPAGGVNLINNDSEGGALENRLSASPSTGRQDENLDGALCLRALHLGKDAVSGERARGRERARHRRLLGGIEQVRADGDLNGIPTLIATGRADGVLPPNHTSRAYVGLNRLVEGEASQLRYVEVLNAQHLDALNGVPGFNVRFVPLHHYFLQVLNLMYAHLSEGTPLPASQVVRATPRGGDPLAPPPLTDENFAPIEPDPGEGDRITFDGQELFIPE
jgi:hydroxybutyrate-dimer hydrolase